MATVDLTFGLGNPGRALLASAVGFVSNMKKRITAPTASTPAPATTSASTTSASSAPPSLASATDQTASSPFSSATVRAQLKSLRRRFTVQLQDAVKRHEDAALRDFLALFEEVSRLERREDLPADVEVAVSELHGRMKLLREAAQEVKDLRTTEELEQVKEAGARKLREAEEELHEQQRKAVQEERERLLHLDSQRSRRQRIERERRNGGDDEEQQPNESAESDEEDEEEKRPPVKAKASTSRGPAPPAKRAKVDVETSPADFHSPNARYYTLRKSATAASIKPTPTALPTASSSSSSSSSRPARIDPPAAVPTPLTSAPSTPSGGMFHSPVPRSQRYTRSSAGRAPLVREAKKREVVESESGLSVLVSQAEVSRRNLTRETRSMTPEGRKAAAVLEQGASARGPSTRAKAIRG